MALAACGSSGSGYGSAPPSSSPAATNPAATNGAGSAALVATATNANLGSILVDRAGKTLYTLTNAGKPVACTGPCLTFWPPLLLPAGVTTAGGGAGVTGLGTVSAAGGTQVTSGGAPLYRFASDAGPGDTNGEGISSFGGTWRVVKAAATGGATPSNGPPTTPQTATAPTTSGGGGYYP